jgi:hypothetical protein
MRHGSIGRLVATYLAIGGLWCLFVSVGNALTGAPSDFLVLSGGGSALTKLLGVLRVLAEQVLGWPLQVYDRFLRPLIH